MKNRQELQQRGLLPQPVLEPPGQKEHARCAGEAAGTPKEVSSYNYLLQSQTTEHREQRSVTSWGPKTVSRETLIHTPARRCARSHAKCEQFVLTQNWGRAILSFISQTLTDARDLLAAVSGTGIDKHVLPIGKRSRRMNRRTPSAEARAGGVRVSGSPPTRFQPPGLGRVLNSLLTQIRAASATALGRGSVSGQGPEPDPAGRGLGHGEEMNEQKCSRGLTAPRPSVRAARTPAALPGVCLVGQGQRTAMTRGADRPKSVQVLILVKGSLPRPQSQDPQQPSAGLGHGPLGHRAQAQGGDLIRQDGSCLIGY